MRPTYRIGVWQPGVSTLCYQVADHHSQDGLPLLLQTLGRPCQLTKQGNAGCWAASWLSAVEDATGQSNFSSTSHISMHSARLSLSTLSTPHPESPSAISWRERGRARHLLLRKRWPQTSSRDSWQRVTTASSCNCQLVDRYACTSLYYTSYVLLNIMV